MFKNIKLLHYLISTIFLGISCSGFSFFNIDTLVICQGESIQLQTVENQIGYSWTPNLNISDVSIFNPIVSPESTTTYLVEVENVQDENLVYNGGFNLGNVGFESEYEFTPIGTFAQGHYGIFTSPTQFNAGFGNCEDFSGSNDGLMMVVDGATAVDVNIWCQTIDVLPGRNYDFSTQITNIFESEPSTLQFSINGNPLGDLLEVEPAVCEWQLFSEQWYSESFTSATICITNQSTIDFGNDFALDDIVFTLADDISVDTFIVIVLESPMVNLDTSICANEAILFDGIWVPADSLHVFSYSASNGCDSLVFFNVGAIDTSYFETRMDTFCLGDTTFHLGFPITADTAICDVYTNVLGCDSSICFVFYFLSEATLDFSIQEPSCSGDLNGLITVSPYAGLPPYDYLWDNGATNPSINNLTAGVYNLSLTDAAGCFVSTSIELTEPDPLSYEVMIAEPICFGDSNGFISFFIDGGNPEYILSFNDQIIGNDFIIENISSGSYNLLIEDAEGCILEDMIWVDQPAPIQIVLPMDTSIQLGCSLEIDAAINSTVPVAIQWVPVIDLDCSTCEDPVASPLSDISYQLLVTDTFGCQAMDTLNIFVEKNYAVFIPNAFSPNGDGINDYFEIYAGKDVEKIISFSIFNRWGGVVFQKDNFLPEDFEGSWDGRFKNKELKPQVFVYMAKVAFVDGTEKVFSGDVSLFK